MDSASNPEREAGKVGTPRTPRGIFLSYRRVDSQAWANHLAGDLRSYYGVDRVYMDIHSNRPGQDYILQIEEALHSARALIAIVGPAWLGGPSDSEINRLANSDDPVRLELEAALRVGIGVVVVLVGGASVPPRQSLPLSISAISVIQALRLADEDWDHDFNRLVETLEKHGLFPSMGDADDLQADLKQWATKVRRYDRRLQATRSRAFSAVVGAVEALGYKQRRIVADAGEVDFRAAGRKIVVKVIDTERSGYSIVVVELASISTRALLVGAGISMIPFGGLPAAAIVWPLLRNWERSLSRGFLDNVQRVLEGRGASRDSVIPFGMSDWRNGRRSV